MDTRKHSRTSVVLATAGAFTACSLLYIFASHNIRERRRRREIKRRFMIKEERRWLANTAGAEEAEKQVVKVTNGSTEQVILEIGLCGGYKISDKNFGDDRDMYQSLRIDGKYVNPFPGWRDKYFYEWIYWQLLRWWNQEKNSVPRNTKDLKATLPVILPDLAAFFGNRPTPSGNRILYPESASNSNVSIASDTQLLDSGSTLSSERSASTGLIVPSANRSLEFVKSSEYSTMSSSASSFSDEADWDNLSVIWFGQSTCLVRIEGWNVLTDPIFA